MRTLIVCGLAAGLALLAAPQDDSWKIEVDNGLVRAARRWVAPHQTVSAAELAPGLLVFLTDYSVRVTGAAPREELRGERGQFLWHPGGRIGWENLGDQRLEIVHVAPRFSAESSYPPPGAKSRKAEFENDLIRVLRVNFPGGGKAPMHRVFPRVVIQLSAAHIKFTGADGHVEEFRMKPGEIRFDAGGGFSGENLGDSFELLEIRLKARKPDDN